MPISPPASNTKDGNGKDFYLSVNGIPNIPDPLVINDLVVTNRATITDLTVSSGQITLSDTVGEQVLEGIGSNLYYDGQLLAKDTDIGNWANFPAVTNVNIADYNINNVTELSSKQINIITTGTDIAILTARDTNKLYVYDELVLTGTKVSTLNTLINDVVIQSTNQETLTVATQGQNINLTAPNRVASLNELINAVTIQSTNQDTLTVATEGQNINLTAPNRVSSLNQLINGVTLNSTNQNLTIQTDQQTGFINITVPTGANGVISLNDIKEEINLTSADGTVVIAPDNQNKTINLSVPIGAGGVSTLNTFTGDVDITSNNNTITINNNNGNIDLSVPPGAGGVSSVNGSAGNITLISDAISIDIVTVGPVSTFSSPLAIAADATANTALANAATAQGTANTALANAATAQGTANTALANAATAQATADGAAAAAAAAQGTANTAIAAAAAAQLTADGAAAAAAAAQLTANTAIVDASAAQLTADGAAALATTANAGVTTILSSYVTNVNGGTSAISINAGSGISVGTSGSTITISNNVVPFVSSFDIYVSPNGNNTTGNGSQQNPYLTIARAITQRATILNTIEVSIILSSGTYTESFTIPQNTYLVGIVTGEANQPVNITGNITMNGASGQSGIVGLQLNAPSTGANITISGAGSFSINNCNIIAGSSLATPSYVLNHSSSGICYMTECRITCSSTNSVEGIFGSATLIMRDCFMTSSGAASMILYQGNLTIRQCNLVNTNTTSGVNPIVNYTPLVINRTCEVSFSSLQYTSVNSATLKGCIVVSNQAATSLVNIVNNLLICEGATNGTTPNNYHCIWKTASSSGNACNITYGNLLAGATAHQIDTNITKTEFNTVP